MVPTPDRIARIYVSFRDAFSSSPSSSSSLASRALVLRLAHRRRARECIVVCISSRAHGRLHKRPGSAHRLYDAKKACISRQQCIDHGLHPPRRPDCTPSTIVPWPPSSPLPTTLAPPSRPLPLPLDSAARVRFFFFSGNRLVKVITLIIHRSDTPSHLFQ